MPDQFTQIPSDAQEAGKEAPVEIKVMPEEFYFKKVKVKSREERPGGGKKNSWIIIVMIVVVVALMAGAAYLFIQSMNLGRQEAAPAPTVTTPAPEPTVPVNAPPVNVPPVNIEPVPVCGDGVCETDEDAASCPADCPPPPEPEPVVPAVLPVAPDADKDGLTNAEEALYTTEIDNPDTDSDGYQDGLEVINLYNPAGFAPHKIEETGLVKIYSNLDYNYSIFYPSAWTTRALDESTSEVLFTSATGEFIQVIVENNESGLALLDWYLASASGTNPADVGTAATKEGVSGIKSPDGLTVYFASGDKIFAIAYNVGVKTELVYKNTFEMMIKSFKLGE